MMSTSEPLEKICGSSTYTLQMDPETCTREADCNRTYHLYIPDSLCDEPSSSSGSSATNSIGTLPLVFAAHCFGCEASAMVKFEEIAQEFNFVLVRPEGVESSWNAKYCCGYALDRKLDDTGFFSRIIDDLDASFDFVSKEMVYGVGWSNGGYMVTYAAHLFRSVAPIAGYQYSASDIMKISSDYSSTGTGTGLFQHHSLNDRTVSFQGCCTNSTMRKCCCGISQEGGDQCTSVDQAFDIWASKVNRCSSGRNTITYKDTSRGIECRSGDGCISNTTLCVYEHSAHFSGGSFSKGFPMFEQVGDFFARDACSMNEGRWSSENKACSCDGDDVGSMYCAGLTPTSLDDQETTPGIGFSSNVSIDLFVAGAIILLVGAIIRKYWKVVNGIKKKNDGWEHVPSEEPSEIELQQKPV